jgi:hypothetical protein
MKEVRVEREYKTTVIPEKINVAVNICETLDKSAGKLYPTVLNVIIVKNKESRKFQSSSTIYPTVPVKTIRTKIIMDITNRLIFKARVSLI